MFDERLKNLRIARGLSQQQVADNLELKVNTYRNYENNEREPSSMTLLKIARYFGVTLDYLLDYHNLALNNNYNINTTLSDRQKRIIELFDQMTEPQQDNIIGRAELFVEQNEGQSVEVYRAARSSDNHEPEIAEMSSERVNRIEIGDDFDEDT